jgi:AcrR family transcriptional regulator
MFAENSFFQTKVEQIARLSGVYPATVYAQCGGKQGLLRSLMDSWTQAPMVAVSMQESLAAEDAAGVMRALSTTYLQITRQWGDVIQVVIDVAPHDDESAAVLATAQSCRPSVMKSSVWRGLYRAAAEPAFLTARYVFGPDVVIHLAHAKAVISSEHQALTPALLRSQRLSLLYRAVRRGDCRR